MEEMEGGHIDFNDPGAVRVTLALGTIAPCPWTHYKIIPDKNLSYYLQMHVGAYIRKLILMSDLN